MKLSVVVGVTFVLGAGFGLIVLQHADTIPRAIGGAVAGWAIIFLLARIAREETAQ